jgi:hypothetical protein
MGHALAPLFSWRRDCLCVGVVIVVAVFAAAAVAVAAAATMIIAVAAALLPASPRQGEYDSRRVIVNHRFCAAQ